MFTTFFIGGDWLFNLVDIRIFLRLLVKFGELLFVCLIRMTGVETYTKHISGQDVP